MPPDCPDSSLGSPHILGDLFAFRFVTENLT